MAKKKNDTSVEIKSVELYLNECYSCRSEKYQALIDWYIAQGLPLKQYQVHRIPLDKGLIQMARSMEQDEGIKPPFVVVITENGKKYVYEYQRFLKEGIKMFDKAKQDRIRKQILVKSETKTEEVKEKRKKTKKTALLKDEAITTAIEE